MPTLVKTPLVRVQADSVTSGPLGDLLRQAWRRAAVGALALGMSSVVVLFGVLAISEPGPQAAVVIADPG